MTKTTIGLIFCKMAHCILLLFMMLFLIGLSLLNLHNWIMLIISLLIFVILFFIFMVNFMIIGHNIETYLKENNILKEEESEDNII